MGILFIFMIVAGALIGMCCATETKPSAPVIKNVCIGAIVGEIFGAIFGAIICSLA